MEIQAAPSRQRPRVWHPKARTRSSPVLIRMAAALLAMLCASGLAAEPLETLRQADGRYYSANETIDAGALLGFAGALGRGFAV